MYFRNENLHMYFQGMSFLSFIKIETIPIEVFMFVVNFIKLASIEMF